MYIDRLRMSDLRDAVRLVLDAYAHAYDLANKLRGLDKVQSRNAARLRMLRYTVDSRFGKYIFRALRSMRLFSVKPLFSIAFDPVVLVLRLKGKTVGLVRFVQIEQGIWELLDLAVRPDFRNRGLGAKLLSEAISQTRKLKGQRMILSVLAQNSPATRLYERFGFKVHDVIYTMKLDL